MISFKTRLSVKDWIALLLIAVTVFLDSTTAYSRIHLRPLSYALFFVALAAGVYSLWGKRGRDLALRLGLVLIGAASYGFSGHCHLFLLLSAACLLSGEQQDLYLKTAFAVRIAVVLTVILHAFLFLGGGEVVAVMKSGRYVYMGITLGFHHPNQLALAVSSLLILYLCIRQRPMTPRVFLAALSIALAGLICTGSRSMLLCIGFFFLGVFLFRKRRIPLWFCFGFFLLITLIGVVIPAAFPDLPQPFRWLDQWCSNRANLSSGVFRAYPLTLFGLNLQAPLRLEDMVVDNGYVQLLFSYGIVGFAAWLAMNLCLMYRLLKAGQKLAVLALLTFATWGLMEDILILSSINFPIILWCLCFTNSAKPNTTKMICLQHDLASP